MLREHTKKKKIKTMNIKIAINPRLSIIESKNKLSKQSRNRTIDMEIIWRVISWEGKGREWGKMYRDYEVQIGRYRIDRGILRTG